MKSRRTELAERAFELRKNMTIYEKKLWYGFLRDYDPSFKAQKVIGDYIVDFYCRKVRVSIEIDGDSHFTEKSRSYDFRRTLRLEMREIFELRFTNLEVKENFEGVCEIIHKVVQSRRNDTRSLDFEALKNKR